MGCLAPFSLNEMNDLKTERKSPMLGGEFVSVARRALAARRLGD